MKFAVQQARAELRNDLEDAGFPELADQLADGASVATHFDYLLKSDEDIPIGASKLGGYPDLPDDFSWPRRRRVEREFEPHLPLRLQKTVDRGPSWEFSLSFVCQLNLMDVHTDVLGGLGLPKHGILSLFYDAEQQPWGYDPAVDRGGWLVVWVDPQRQKLIRTSLPTAHGIAFASARLSPRLLLTIPDHLTQGVGIEPGGIL